LEVVLEGPGEAGAVALLEARADEVDGPVEGASGGEAFVVGDDPDELPERDGRTRDEGLPAELELDGVGPGETFSPGGVEVDGRHLR
jgi:hypothetical protein